MSGTKTQYVPEPALPTVVTSTGSVYIAEPQVATKLPTGKPPSSYMPEPTPNSTPNSTVYFTTNYAEPASLYVTTINIPQALASNNRTIAENPTPTPLPKSAVADGAPKLTSAPGAFILPELSRSLSLHEQGPSMSALLAETAVSSTLQPALPKKSV